MAKKQGSRSDYWRQIIGEQEGSGLAVRTFCEEAEVNEHSFYNWRARLRNEEPVRFALVEPVRKEAAGSGDTIEVTLATGERLRIGASARADTVRLVLAALRA